ncbi:MAG: translation initiation factor IF-2, partial [Defluviitaleaceae bacterium]|nr:translation initiation factor IF-2 [Defluviitaleaceae bacterium]
MPKIRVHELAKELNVTNKFIIEKMGSYGKSVSNHMSSVDDADVSRLKNDVKGTAAPPIPVESEKKISPRPLGADGKPLPPPPRPLGANGKPLPRPRPIGADGKPLPPPPRPLGADGKPLPRPRPLGADGKPLPRPRPLGADGKPLPPPPRPLGADGKPLPPRPRPVDSEGNPLPRISQPRPTENETPSPAPIETPAPPQPEAKRPEVRQNQNWQGQQQRSPQQNNFNRTQNNFNRPQGDRPQGNFNRPQGDRPQGNFNRPQGDRPQNNFNRPQGDRPQGNFNRPQGQNNFNRPQGQGGFSPRPQGQGGFAPRPGGNAPGRPQGGGFAGRPAGGAPGRGGVEVKKTEPTKDDKRQQWNRLQQANTISKKDKKDNFKENRQGLDRRTGKTKPAKRIITPRVQPTVTMITVAPEITVRVLAEKLLRSNADVIKILMKKGLMVTANQTIDFETASMVAETFGVIVDEYVEVDVFEEAFSTTDDEESLLPRPPIVVVMGHVDHGKTSLLDVIRNANVQQGEAGGITQHIGAYSVRLKDNENKRITFLDTPGHEAFTAMRMRGAQITDIAILVVAADDGVMPQTIEAINHAKAAGVEIIVAITMMDKPDANPDKVKAQLAEKGLQSEDWGGTTITVPVSARTKMGIEQLLEMILLVAEMKELRANPNKPARGSIIEAKLDKGRGPVATVLVQEGTLRVGDPVVAGACYGKVRAMINSRGENVTEAKPSRTVEIIGLAEVPTTGDTLYAATSDKQARQLSETVVAKGRENLIKATQGKVSLDDLFNQIQAGQVKDLNIVVKADVQGSVEALRGSLEKLTNDSVRVRIIHTGVGAIIESDVMLASASNAIILGFNVRPEPTAKS